MITAPGIDEIRAAAERMRGYVRRTPLLAAKPIKERHELAAVGEVDVDVAEVGLSLCLPVSSQPGGRFGLVLIPIVARGPIVRDHLSRSRGMTWAYSHPLGAIHRSGARRRELLAQRNTDYC